MKQSTSVLASWWFATSYRFLSTVISNHRIPCSSSCSSASSSAVGVSSSGPSTAASKGAKPGRTVRKFTINEYILTEVCAGEDTFSKPVSNSPWIRIDSSSEKISAKMAGIAPRAMKERGENLVRQFRTQDNCRARQSGTDEEYGEKERLLQEALELFEEKERYKAESVEKKNRHDVENAKAAVIRNKAAETLKGKGRPRKILRMFRLRTKASARTRLVLVWKTRTVIQQLVRERGVARA